MRKDVKTKPCFESVDFIRYEREFRRHLVNPLAVHKAGCDTAVQTLKAQQEHFLLAQGLELSNLDAKTLQQFEKEVAQVFAVSEQLQLDTAAAKQWYSGKLLFEAKQVGELLGIPNTRQWRYNHGIGRRLSAAQAAYLLDGRPNEVNEDFRDPADGLAEDLEEDPNTDLEDPIEVEEADSQDSQDDETEQRLGEQQRQQDADRTGDLEVFMDQLDASHTPTKEEKLEQQQQRWRQDEQNHQIRQKPWRLVRTRCPTEGIINPAKPTNNPLGKYVMRKAISKVGTVIGTWTLNSCISESESTTNNAKVYYAATCNVCGNLAEILYRFAKQKACAVCAQAERDRLKVEAAVRNPPPPKPVDRSQFMRPKVVWVAPGGFIWSRTIPETATGKIIFTNSGMTANIQALGDEDLKAQADLRAPAPQSPPSAAQRVEEVKQGDASGTEDGYVVEGGVTEIIEEADEEDLQKLEQMRSGLEIPDF